MKFMKLIYVVDTKGLKAISTASDKKALSKRLSLLKEPYPEGTVFVRVAKYSPVMSIETDERLGYDFLANLFLAAVVAGVEGDVAIQRAIEAGMLEEVKI